MDRLRSGYTTGDGGGSGTSQGQAKILGNLINAMNPVAAVKNAASSKNPFTSSGSSSSGSSSSRGGGSTSSSGSRSSGSSAVGSASWGCPNGATLIREPGGTGNLVCRWNHNGALFAAQPKGGAATTPTNTTPAPDASDVGVDAPDATSQWLQAAGDIFARDPQSMLAVQLQDEYGEGANALYGMLTPYAEAANALYLMQRGTDAAHGSVDDNLAWLQDYWNTLQTPGQRVDTAGALQNLFTAGTDSPLWSFVNTGDPTQQANRALQLIAGGVETGMAPSVAQSIMDRMRLERDRYLGEFARGGATGSFLDYLSASGIDVGQLMGVRP